VVDGADRRIDGLPLLRSSLLYRCRPLIISGSLSGEFDLAAQVLESSDQALNHLGAIAASEVIGAMIFVFDSILEHMPSSREDRGGDRENGFLALRRALRRRNWGCR
jgi:hypothetical protein